MAKAKPAGRGGTRPPGWLLAVAVTWSTASVINFALVLRGTVHPPALFEAGFAAAGFGLLAAFGRAYAARRRSTRA